MDALGHNHSEGRRSAKDRLVEMLAEMVSSALEWEATQLESGPVPSVNHDATGIEYPPTDPQPVPVA